ncbi:MAG: ATP-binding protein [Gammaproteobacteria bacterium]|nr:ATP-binding protein [Gammaproteobacteria bacterium]
MIFSFFKLTSINSRLVIGIIAVVSSFMVLTGITLSKTFYNSAYSALQERLTSQVYLIMADREILPSFQEVNLQVSPIEPSPFNLAIQKTSNNSVYSQLSGYITQADGTILWQSDSNIESTIPPKILLNNGKDVHGKKFFQEYTVNGKPYIGLSIAIFWDLKNPKFPLIYHISDDLTHLNEKISDYQLSLWTNLLLMSAILFITLSLILRWGLKPLREVEQEIKAVEQGEQELLNKSYPDEITLLTQNINQLIHYERHQQQRYRNALGDLAHSLKTPLAIVRGHNFTPKVTGAQSIKELETNYISINDAVDRMNSIIEYQLQRAISNNPSPHIQYLQLPPIVNMLLDSMKKIYREKDINFHLNMSNDIQFKIDEGDFMEVLGNLLDNACKWCKKDIFLKLSHHDSGLQIQISDDGPGIASEMINDITKRGVRADEFTPGHGVGLAIVQDIVSVYNGQIEFTSTPTGGLNVNIHFKL